MIASIRASLCALCAPSTLCRIAPRTGCGTRSGSDRFRPTLHPGVARTLRVLGMVCALQPALLQAADTLLYGGDRDFPPFEYLDDEGRPQGFQIELLAALAREAGLDMQARLDDWPRIEADFRAGRLDAIAMSHTGQRHDWALFARPHATPAMALYHRRDTPEPQALADLLHRTIAVADTDPMRETRADFFAGPNYRFLALADHAAALAAVRDGRADYALMPQAYGHRLLKSDGYTGLLASRFALRLQDYGFAVAPGREALRERLDAALMQLERAGTLEALRVKWLSSHHDLAVRRELEARIEWQRLDLLALALAAGGALVWLGVRLRRRAQQAGTERQRRSEAEQALRLAEEKLARAFTRHPDGMLVAEQDSARVLEVNEALCALLGCRSDVLIGQPLDALSAFIDADSLAMLRALLAQDGAIGSAPVNVRRSDGELRTCLVTADLFGDQGAREVFAVVRDVTEQLRSNEALRSACDTLAESARAQAAALAQSRLVLARTDDELRSLSAAISHDLRGPLRVVSSLSAMLREDLKAGDLVQVARHAERIDAVARRMDDIVEALTRLARASQHPLQRAPVDMNACAAHAWAMLEDMGLTARVAVRIADLPPAEGDASMIAQVWQNLLGNACKYSARATDPRVAVDAFSEDGRQWYRVTDNGAGFNMELAGHLFEPFRRLHADKDFAGTGIGLSIVRRIVRRHGGDIRARGQVGVGAVFEFTLQATDVGEEPPSSGCNMPA